MSIVVMKFGGSSVADADRIRAAATRAIAARKAGNKVVMTVSAMGDTTDDLVRLARQVNDNPPKREMDQLLATGEQVTISLMAMAMEAMERTREKPSRGVDLPVRRRSDGVWDLTERGDECLMLSGGNGEHPGPEPSSRGSPAECI